MAYIKIEYAGKKTFGGYLSVDGGPQVVLKNGDLIKVDAGEHNLDFKSIPFGNNSTVKTNAFVGAIDRFSQLGNEVMGTITKTLEEDDVLVLSVVSDADGHILDLPSYTIYKITDSDVAKLDEAYVDNFQYELDSEIKSLKKELLICIFGGWLGIYKFYKGKFILGLLYMFSLGFLGIGWLTDIIILIVKICQVKKTKKRVS